MEKTKIINVFFILSLFLLQFNPKTVVNKNTKSLSYNKEVNESSPARVQDIQLLDNGFTSRVSNGYDGSQSNGESGYYSTGGGYGVAISGDGRYVAFESTATNLVPNDTNGYSDIFVYDRQANSTKRVSVGINGEEANEKSFWVSISADGSRIAFSSLADNLVEWDTNGYLDVFVYDMNTEETIRVSVYSDGHQMYGGTWANYPSISGDGDSVAFASNAVIEGSNGNITLVVHKISTGETKNVVLSSEGIYGDFGGGTWTKSSFSYDGRYIAFDSGSTNLVPNDTNEQVDVFVRDLVGEETTRVSITTNGDQGNQVSRDASISGDGRYVVFQSFSLLAHCPDTCYADIYIHDRSSGTTNRISTPYDGTGSNDNSFSPAISADGRYVVYASKATNLVPDDTNTCIMHPNNCYDIFVRDLTTNENYLISVNSNNTQANDYSDLSAISDNGRFVAFESLATNLVQNDTNGYSDIFVRDRGLGDICPENNWLAKYYNNRNLQGIPLITRCDQNIDFQWGQHSPNQVIPPDNFSVSWEMTFTVLNDGWYRFRSFTDDGLRLYIDGKLIIDDWIARSFAEKSTTQYLTIGNHAIKMEYVEWANDAMAYLKWYLCSSGEDDCSMNIIPDYQTRYLDQPMAPSCATDPNQTIARYGCYITSISMALQKIGINTNPVELNNWLSTIDPDTGQPRGYDCEGNLKSPKEIEIFARDIYHIEIKFVPFLNRPINDVIDIIRNKSLPVIMQGAGHFVLAVDAINNNNIDTLGINDPYHSFRCNVQAASSLLPPSSILVCGEGPLRHATTLPEENTYNGSKISRGYYQLATTPRTPSLNVNIQGSEALIIDSQGRRVGYDPSSQNTLLEIPNSSYFDSTIVPPGETSQDILKRFLYLSEDAGGVYILRLTSMNNLSTKAATSIEINIIGYDADFTKVETTIIPTDNVTEYKIEYLPREGLLISPLSPLYLPIINR